MSLGPRVQIPQAEERRKAVNDLISVIGDALPKLSSKRELMWRHFAAMGLARCTRLLRGMSALHAAQIFDASGVLFRPLWETWLISSYCLYLREPAFEAVRGAAVEQVAKLPQDPFSEAKELLQGWTGAKRKLNVKNVAGEVAGALKARGKHDHQLVESFYEVLYRGESALNIHAGVHSIAGHLVNRDSFVGINPVRYSPDDGIGSLLLAATFTGILAKDVFSEFGVASNSLAAISERITQGVTAENLVLEPD